MKVHVVLPVVSLLLIYAKCHSWIDCVKYDDPTNGINDASKCKARPRNYKNHVGGGVFGADTGYNSQDSKCMYQLNAGSTMGSFYTSDYPMATYTAGETVYLTYPAKNHVAATCTNEFIPDTSNEVWMSPMNPTSDNLSAWTKAADFGAAPSGVKGSMKGFQKCPKFCDNMDKALCYNQFTIPAGTQPGYYTFQWRWVFNPNTPAYQSCWDAYVTAGSGSAPPTTTSAPTSPTSTTTAAPLVGDAIRILNPPTYRKINSSEPFVVNVQYSATKTSDVVVDLLSVPSYNWFGKAIKLNVGVGQGSLSMTIAVQNNPGVGSYIIKPWIVEAGKGEANNGWAYELDRKEYALSMGLTQPPSTNNISKMQPSLWLIILAIICVLY